MVLRRPSSRLDVAAVDEEKSLPVLVLLLLLVVIALGAKAAASAGKAATRKMILCWILILSTDVWYCTVGLR
jgi:hypothetical protein